MQNWTGIEQELNMSRIRDQEKSVESIK
jgi:hypothetical protein